MKPKLLLSLALSGLLGFGGLAGGAGGKGGGELEGTWLTTEVNFGGKQLPKEQAEKLQLMVTIRRDKYAVQVQGKVEEEGTFKADPSRKPKTLDLKIESGKNKGKTQRGIYRVDGDILSVSFAPAGARERPGGFTFEEGTKYQAYFLKRQREKKKAK
jgi:uncharacterized protein (TIGR03067 family)